MSQMTRVASFPVEIPKLPGDLDAYPIYRVQIRDGVEKDSTLLRLEIRAASISSAATWRDALESIEPRIRDWLLKNASGQARRITARLGPGTLELLYRWCAAGIVIVEVEPPSGHGATHGPLVRWRLTEQVRAHSEDIAYRVAAQHSELANEAKALAQALAGYPRTRLLGKILTEPHDATYLEHAVAVARALVIEVPELPHQHALDGGTDAICFVLRRLARGSIKDYAPDPDAIAHGGQAVVSGATHKATRVRVAVKRLRIRDEDSVARMKREVDAGRIFGEHPNVMPVLDADIEFQWLIMPLATGTARTYAAMLRAPDRLRELVDALCAALRVPHETGWIHRDLKPDNILWFDNRWVVADWGLGRRPRGETSNPGRTRTGTGFGTEGFAAPELFMDAHEVGPPADIYSIGQLIGAILTGHRPQANIPLLPEPGPWRTVVERSTRRAPSERPRTVDDLLELIESLRCAER